MGLCHSNERGRGRSCPSLARFATWETPKQLASPLQLVALARCMGSPALSHQPQPPWLSGTNPFLCRPKAKSKVGAQRRLPVFWE